MVHPLAIQDYFAQPNNFVLIDVRSPKEFADGHIEGAVNVPLFSDDERALIGTLYKQQGRELAVKKGLACVAPRMNELVDVIYNSFLQHTADGQKKQLVVYCARGGMRSKSVAMLVDYLGSMNVFQLSGGFKAYKNFLRSQAPLCSHIVLIGGKTGSGKTYILQELAKRGEQVLDLEGLSNHRGSSFGALGKPNQPTQEQFIVSCLHTLVTSDRNRPLWVEHEGNRLGNLHVPRELWGIMEKAPVLYIDVPIEQRKKNILKEYGHFSADELIACATLLEKRLGGFETRRVIEFIRESNTEKTVEILLKHYDKSYEYATKHNAGNTFFTLPLNGDSSVTHAEEILAFWHTKTNNSVSP